MTSAILAEAAALGWQLAASVDLSARSDFDEDRSDDADSWFFCRPKRHQH